MPTMSFDIPPGQGQRVINALCAEAGLPPTQANAVQANKNYIIRTVQAYERLEAINAAIAAVAEPTPVTPT